MKIQEKQPIMWSWIKTLLIMQYIYIILYYIILYIYIYIWGWTSIDPSDFGARTPSIQPTGHVVNFQPRRWHTEMAHGDGTHLKMMWCLGISMLHLNHLKHPILTLMISSPSVPSVPSIFRAFRDAVYAVYFNHFIVIRMLRSCVLGILLHWSFRSCVKAWLCPADNYSRHFTG